jgi:uncharacterized membrane protein
MNEFSASTCIRFGWETFKKRPWTLMEAVLIIWAVIYILNFIGTYTGSGIHAIAFTVAQDFVLILIAMGMTAFLLRAHDAIESVTLKALWHPYPFWKYVGAVLIFGILALFGLILLVIPGLIVITIFQFSQYVVIDRKLGPIAAMKESARITKGYRWEIFALFIFSVILNILGAICLGVGLLITVPVTSLAVIHAYRTLEAKAGTIAATA